MSLVTLLLFVAGLVLLLVGAELLVKGASRLAALVGISPLVIGLTVVAFGTSAPELAVSVQGAWTGAADVALGNVLGSNVFNVLFVLGLSALVAPLVVAQQLVRVEVPLMIVATVAVFLMALDRNIGRIDGALLAGGILAYTVYAVRKSRRETKAVQEEYAQEVDGKPRGAAGIALQVGFLVVGLAMLVLGSGWLVDGAVAIATALGLSERVIALTLVAAGTSLPEVATSVMASARGERDIAVGNAIGSNLFNLLSVLGCSALVAPAGIAAAEGSIVFDLPVAIGVAVACLPIFFRDYRISRWEGGLFFGYYVLYVAYLFVRISEHPLLGPFTVAMLGFVLPLTAITLVVVAWRGWRARRAAEAGATR